MLSNRYLPVFALGIALILMSWAGHHAQAATINVPGDFATIQGAINDPNTVTGDEIVVAPGTYNEIIDFLGKAITLRSSGGAGVTTIDGGAAGSVVTCSSGETATSVLDGFAITNGSATNGGGMFNDSSSPTVTDCTFSGNTATDNGGGMYTSSSSPTVTNCTFSGNTATIAGAGMYNTNSSPTVTNCTFSGNTAIIIGSGMYNNNSSPTVTNCTFSGNTGASFGGGMCNISSSPTVTNCTFSGNTADFGGGMFNINNSSPTVTNCILWGNSDSGGMDESAQIHTVDGTPGVNYSDVQGEWTGAGGTGNVNVDPNFVDADGADDMIGTQDDNLRLLAVSPCIDAGDNNSVPVGITTDLDGRLRFVDDLLTPDTGNGGPPTVDMGAYEYACTGNLDDIADVTLPDFALFTQQWMQTACGLCGGADFTGDHDVTLEDLLIQIANWLCGTGP